jgi:hypothetical protein
LGRMNAPRASSFMVSGDDMLTRSRLVFGFWGYEKSGRAARTTLAKCVGTETLGGLPMTS